MQNLNGNASSPLRGDIASMNSEVNSKLQENQTNQSAQAFIDMADTVGQTKQTSQTSQTEGISNEMLNRNLPPQNAQIQEPLATASTPSLSNIDKSGIDQGRNLGPKYLSALSQLDSIIDTKAIQVQLPMSMRNVELTAITGAEEQALKTASVAPDSFLKKLNELLYNHTVFVDGDKPTFNDFLLGVYPPDKATLIWGLLSSSYIVLPDMERTCDKCQKVNLIKSVPKELIHGDTFKKIWDKPLSPAEYTEKQDVFDGYVSFELGIPNERDRIIISSMIHPEQMKKNISNEGDIMSRLDMLVFFTRSITVGEPGNRTVLTDLTQDIYPFLNNLNPKIADGIRSKIDITVFDEYMPDFYITSTCSGCGNEQKINVDPEITLFRKSLAL